MMSQFILVIGLSNNTITAYNGKSRRILQRQSKQTMIFLLNVEGGESSSQFWWFAMGKIKLSFFDIFCFDFGTAVAKIFNKYKKISPPKNFWKL